MKQTLPRLKNACIQALEIDGDRSAFDRIADPTNVLEMIKTIEGGLSPEAKAEVIALLIVMANFIEGTPANQQRDALLTLARQHLSGLGA